MDAVVERTWMYSQRVLKTQRISTINFNYTKTMRVTNIPIHCACHSRAALAIMADYFTAGLFPAKAIWQITFF